MIDLRQERANSFVDVEKLTTLLYGGNEEVKLRREIFRLIYSDPIFKKDDLYFMSRTQRYKRGIEKARKLHELILENDLLSPEKMGYVLEAVDEMFPTSLHYGMFLPTLLGQADEDQQAEWLPKAFNMEMVGSYAQTEMGHGSNLRGLETTATFDRATDEFVIHSPTQTSTKCWAGGLGKTSNTCVLPAKLIIDGKDHGLHIFLVPLRDMESHEPLPGVTVFDMGPKMGFEAIDNGYARFDQVRIPRRNMLMRFAKVDRSGSYSKPPHEKLSYGTMIMVRAQLVHGASTDLARAVTIATRYSSVRRQFAQANETLETKVLDYRQQQYLLFPLMAAAFAFRFTAINLMQLYQQMVKSLSGGDLSVLPEVHASSSGLKALTTSIAAEGIEICRKACGGHGYLKFSGLPTLYMDSTAACTYEGENNLIRQQTSRHIIKIYREVQAGSTKASGNLNYLNHIGDLLQPAQFRSATEFLKPEIILKAFEARVASIVVRVCETLSLETKRTLNQEDAWNAALVDIGRLANAHCELIVVRNFFDAVSKIDDSTLKPPLVSLSLLYAAWTMERSLGEFMESGHILSQHGAIIREAVQSLLLAIRGDAVRLMDAWDFSDDFLCSALGRYDGDVYRHLLEMAKKEPLNMEHINPRLARPSL
eukprot:TRINITY_DN3247_c0_g5_i1.p1 TRINITY_DN3247_c0_g5~~TRINITY_DN3247_c0_g5_i1.p1  ORF type:complete len:669 (+),score=153.34 TRINITY_DN3247_c0_g5_i1:60-2009(+)